MIALRRYVPVLRFGQKKSCYVYRFLAQGTMEEKIYDRQITKQSLSCRVIDEQQIERHFNWSDLNDLYVFDVNRHIRRPAPSSRIEDELLNGLLTRRKEWIVTFHEHDSLLENKSEEELNETERVAAWEDFAKEGLSATPQPPPSPAVIDIAWATWHQLLPCPDLSHFLVRLLNLLTWIKRNHNNLHRIKRCILFINEKHIT